MAIKSGKPRVGMLASPVFEATVSVKKEAKLVSLSESSAVLGGNVSHPIATTIVAHSIPVTTSFQREGVFSAAKCVLWASQPITAHPLIRNYQHSQSPVKYTRLDDLVLSYVSGRLVGVARESGDTLALEYSDTGQLIKVTDIYTGVIKDFSYNGTELTGVTVSKLA